MEDTLKLRLRLGGNLVKVRGGAGPVGVGEHRRRRSNHNHYAAVGRWLGGSMEPLNGHNPRLMTVEWLHADS